MKYAPLRLLLPLTCLCFAVSCANDPTMARQNRLAHEKSPYLLQHKDNPVDWYPWGEEAFERARAEDKPIFLSIGYSTCHWCHVMEHESFEDEEVAALMNDAFVSIKVDREERPDIDNLYMSFCQMMGGSCGWPLNVVMTPDKKPFFVATYIPKESRYGRPGMIELVPRLKQLWRERRADVEASAREITEALRKSPAAAPDASSSELDAGTLREAFLQFSSRFDAEHGGFGTAPKFPSPHNLLFLLRYAHRSDEAAARVMVTRTLDRMRLGGIFDHVGFGFHRYATDTEWKLPHFEKMLYDQAMLAMAYTEAYQATGKATYAETAREIFTYVLRDMTAPEGGFFSAEDADSEGREGKFYLWTVDEVREVLGPDEAAFVIETFNMTPEGNFEDEATRQKTGENILYLKKPLDEIAAERGESAEAVRGRWEAARRKLFAHREKRVHPGKDDKVLTDWNGLMIAALAMAARALDAPALDAPEYAEAARRAAAFIRTTMRTDDGRLLHRWREGDAALQANLDDYAFMVWGLIELYETTFDPAYLEEALALNDVILTHFRDDENGGFFFTPDDGEELLARQKELYDGAIPSGNSVAMYNLLRLSRLTGNTDFEAEAARVSAYAGGLVRRMPSGFAAFLIGLDLAVGPTFEVVVVGRPGAADTEAMLSALRSRYLPNAVVIFRPEGEASAITRLAPYTATQHTLGGKATAYVCRNFVCNRPTTDIGKMLALLGE